MTSKKAIEDPQVKALPITTRKVRSAWSNPFFILLGAALTGSGVAMGSYRAEAAQLEPFFVQVEAFGLTSGSVVGFGLVTFALGMIGRSVRRQAKAFVDQNELELAVADLGADTTLLCNQMQELRGDHLESKNGVASLRNEVRDWRSKDRSGELNDSLFRLAASLDQLHARIDKRIDVLAGQITSQIEDLGHLVEASRDFLQESVEGCEERLARPETTEEAPQGPEPLGREEFQAFAEELRATLHELGQDPFEGQRTFAAEAEVDAGFAEEPETVELTVEDEPLAPVGYAEAEVVDELGLEDPLAEPEADSTLGVLDSMDDDGGTWSDAGEQPHEDPGLTMLDEPEAAPAGSGSSDAHGDGFAAPHGSTPADPGALAPEPQAVEPHDAASDAGTPQTFEAPLGFDASVGGSHEHPAASTEPQAEHHAPQAEHPPAPAEPAPGATSFGAPHGPGDPMGPAPTAPPAAPHVGAHDAGPSIDEPPMWTPESPTGEGEPTEIDLDGPPAALPGEPARAADADRPEAQSGAGDEDGQEAAQEAGQPWRATAAENPWFPPQLPPSPPEGGA